MPRKSLHPTFQKKRVLELLCRYCSSTVCSRGMKAILLADTAVELFSTDLPPVKSIHADSGRSVDLVNESYQTAKCKCKIKDIACLGCGNIVGYTVVQPCRHCLESCNNGHFWMFHSYAVEGRDRLDFTGDRILQWGKLLEMDELGLGPHSFMKECLR